MANPAADDGPAPEPADDGPAPETVRVAARGSGRAPAAAALVALAALAVLGAALLAVVVPRSAPDAGRIALIDPDGALSIVDGRGGAPVAVPLPGVVLGPPAWSPDGTRIAAVGTGPDTASVYVVDVPAGRTEVAPRANPVYASADERPFYLSWSPDALRVAFLATEPDGISLRTAHADGREPDDGPDRDGVLRVGAPLYFAWEDAARLLLHVGVGSGAFTGEIDLAGAPAGPEIPGTGDFRAVAASRDGGEVAYVSGEDAAGEIVIEARDGSGRQHLAVFGPAAVAFDPAGATLATIAAAEPVENRLAFPLGPLRLIDAETGAVRTLIDDAVVAFFWSPDGRTLAALRLARTGGPQAAAMPPARLAATGVGAAAGAGAAAATPEPALAVHLTFVDAAEGDVRSDRAVRLGDEFVGTVLPYFDQYALSHRVWAPDSTSIVLPLRDESGRTRATVLDADGADPRPVADAIHAFWAP